MIEDERSKPKGWYSNAAKAKRSASFQARRNAAALRRADAERQRAASQAVTAPLRSAAQRRLAALGVPVPQDTERLAKARARTRKKRQRDVIDVRDKAASGPIAAPVPPTPEQMRHADFVVAPVYDTLPDGRRTVRGRAYQRRPKFETIDGLEAEHLRALRHYRRVFDGSEVSEVKSALDMRPRGCGSDGAIARLESIAGMRFELAAVEAVVPSSLLATLRAVALHDLDFKHLAMERYGSRHVERIDVSERRPTVKTTLEPRSGRHRAIIREEFMAGVTALAQGLRPALHDKRHATASFPNPGVTSEPLLRPVDPAFLDDDGRMLPFGMVSAIIRARLATEAADGDAE